MEGRHRVLLALSHWYAVEAVVRTADMVNMGIHTKALHRAFRLDRGTRILGVAAGTVNREVGTAR